MTEAFDERWHAGAHVLYEFNQLSAMYVVLARIEFGQVECEEEIVETVRLATLEALLLHARCIIEFLVGRPTRADGRSRKPEDIPPTWFAPEWPTPTGAHRLDRWLKLLDVNISHLSLERIRIGELGDHDSVDWTSAMFMQIADELTAFVDHVTDPGWRDAFRRATRKLIAGIDEYPDLATGS